MDSQKNECDCCGTCCMNGGPALHTDDFDLIASGLLSLDSLVTIRLGEMVYQPFSSQPEAVEKEFLKIQGRGADWCCRFFDRISSTCTIYRNRPVACSLLKCWDTEDILNIAGKDLLNRFDFIKDDDPLYALIRQHDAECPVPKINEVVKLLQVKEKRNTVIANLERLVNTDLRFRVNAARQYNLSVAKELFYFGRPVFQLLAPAGIACEESPAGLSLYFTST